MATLETTRQERTTPTALKRSGYVIAIVINLIMMFVANNILSWGWFPFLTDDFTSLLPLINISLAATILANVCYLAFDPAWFKSLTQIGLNLISLIVSIRFYQVFPFDFSTSQFNWETVTRVVIILAIVGTGIAIVVESVKLIRSVVGGPTTESR
jgi:hypothetical protein